MLICLVVVTEYKNMAFCNKVPYEHYFFLYCNVLFSGTNAHML